MDPLSDLLCVVRLDGAFFYAVEATDPWSVEAVAARELSPRIMPAAEHLISYHILTEGRCYGGLIGEEQVELAPGDAIVFPHGDAHVMSSGRGVRVGPDVNTSAPARYPETIFLGDHGARRSSAGSSAAIAGRSTLCSRHSHAGCTCGACRTPGMTASPAS
jgi:cupin